MTEPNRPDAPKPQAVPDAELRKLRVGKPKEVAGGLTAIASSMRMTLAETDALSGARALLSVNQHGGFDCPGCAWPDPDGHRSVAEFCENGAKAVAEEATSKRVTPAFFAEWAVSDLSRHDEYWLGKQGRLTHPMIKRQGADHYEPLAWAEATKRLGLDTAYPGDGDMLVLTPGKHGTDGFFVAVMEKKAAVVETAPTTETEA